MSNKLYLAFCEDNKSIAKEITNKLSRAKFKFTECSSAATKEGEGLTFSIARTGTPGLLLLSDNFLKSETCMLNMLSFIQNSTKSENMQIVVVDGQYPSGDVSTSFDRVSNVIKYMNYWQEVYLEMRKKKRTIDSSQEEAFNTKLQNIKTISSEIGDLLRVVRNKDYWTFDQMKANQFEVFFKKFDPASYSKYVKKAAGDAEPEPFKNKSTPPPVTKPINKEKQAPKTINEINAERRADVLNQKKSDGTKEKISTSSSVALNDRFSTSEEKKEFEAIDRIKQMNQPDQIENKLEEEEQQIEEVLQEVHPSKTEEEVEQGEDSGLSELEDVFEDEAPDLDDSVDHANSVEPEDEVKNTPSYIKEEAFLDEEIEEVEITEDITDDFDPMEDIEVEDITELITDDDTELVVDISTQIIAAASLIKDGAHKAGCQHFDQLIEENPDNQQLKLEYASLLKNEIGHSDKAKEQLEQIIKLNPKHPEAYHLMAEIAEENNDFLLAKKYYEKVVSIEPKAKGVYFNLGLIYMNFIQDKPKQAGKYFKKALQQNEAHEEAHYHFALLLKNKLDRPLKAEKHFKKLLELNPTHPTAYLDFAILKKYLGDKMEAARLYQKACLINPDIKTEKHDSLFSLDKTKLVITPEAETKTVEAPVQNPVPTAANHQVVLITGATSGIGYATAKKFAENGFRVILTGRRDERLIEIKEDFIKSYEADVKILPFDVRKLDEAKIMIDNLGEAWQNIDILINNAGLAKGYDPVHEADIEHWDTMIDTNIKGLMYMTRLVSPGMVARRSGHIINVCSSAGKSVYPNGSVYCATKHAVDALTKGMRLDLYKYNIRVGQVSPAHVEETEFAYVRFEDKDRAKIYEDFQPLKASDVADSIYFIATAPAHVNIQDIYLMGKQQAENTYIDRSGR